MGWVEGLGLDLLRGAVKELQADVLLCLGESQLFDNLSAEYAVSVATRLVGWLLLLLLLVAKTL